MAKAIPTYEEAGYARPATHEITLEIEGLMANSDGTFTLRGVKPVDIDPTAIKALADQMIEQGVPRMLAERLADEAMMSIYTGLLADALGQRTRRIF